MAVNCRLCDSELTYALTQRILSKYEVKYFTCTNCSLAQTELPYWLEEAYSSAISRLDTGAIHRNIFCTRLTLVLCQILGLQRERECLDYGGGVGVFTRMMRDAGWRFMWADKYATNTFALGFEADPERTYQLVTAFELLEHLVDVKKEMSTLFTPAHPFVLLSTLLREAPLNPEWWYLSPETGQHVAFYSKDTLNYIARHFGYTAIIEEAYTLFIRKDVPLPSWKRHLLKFTLHSRALTYGFGSILLEIQREKSLTQSDRFALRDTVSSIERTQ